MLRKYSFQVYLFTLLMLTSCGNSSDTESEKAVFRMNLDAGLTSLDPAFARNQNNIWMTSQLYNGLVELNDSLGISPGIAKSWNISPDGLNYTFTLRNDVWFHKDDVFGGNRSRKVVASDFVYSFSRVCMPKVASPGLWIFNGKVSGVKEYVEGNASSVDGFKAVDDTTLVIHLEKPFPAFISLLGMAYAYVVPKEAIEHYGENFRSNPVGTGPFIFKSWKEDYSLILHKNPDYFEQGKDGRLPYLDAVYVRFIDSRLSAFVELKQGKLDFINGVDKSFKDEVLDVEGDIKPDYKDKFDFDISPQLNTEYLGILVDSTSELVNGHPLSDRKVRKALNHAIDREKMVRYLLNNMGFAAKGGFIPNGLPAYDPGVIKGYEYDPEKASQLLTDAGYPGGKGFPKLTLYSTEKYQLIMEFIQKNFEKIGVRTEIENLKGGTLRDNIYNSKINFWRASWIADYPDEENYLSLFYSGNFAPGGPNTTHYANPEFDRLYDQALAEPSDSSRNRLYQQMDSLMMEDAPIIPLYYDKILRIVNKDVSGLSTNAMNQLFLKRVKKKSG